MTRHFAASVQIEDPDLRSLVWTEDERTGILVESHSRWRGDLVEKRPAVIIKPNGRRNLRLGISDKMGMNAQGFDEYGTFWVGSHTLFCIAGTAYQAEALATEVQREITQFGPELTRNLGLYKFAVAEVGEAAEVEEATENFASPVNVGWCYGEFWTLRCESPRLRRVPVSFLLS